MVDSQARSDDSAANQDAPTSLLWLSPIALFLLAPHLLWGPVPGRPRSLVFGLPRIYSGDEPHYLLMLNSLVNDGDLDLANNYAAVHQGAKEAGELHANTAIDHHVTWLDHGRQIIWEDVYERSPAKWRRDHFGHPIPTRSTKAPDVIIPSQEYSWHQPGMPILLALLLFPLRGTAFIESAAVFCSGISTVVALIFFYALVRPYSNNRRAACWTAAAAFLGTPVWHYGRTLFTEPYLLPCAVSAYTLYLKRGRSLIAGGILSVGVMIKRTMILLYLPLIADALFRRDWAGALKLSAMFVGSLVLLAVQNQYFYGSPFGWDMQAPLGNPLTGALSLMFSRDFGLIPFAPAALAALAAWPGFFRRNFRHAAVLSSAFLLYFGFWASFACWWGGYCYGPRYLVPVLPFLFTAFPAVADESERSFSSHWVIGLLLLFSISINFIGAIACGNAWGSHPTSFLNP